jgi:hypothetical protein
MVNKSGIHKILTSIGRFIGNEPWKNAQSRDQKRLCSMKTERHCLRFSGFNGIIMEKGVCLCVGFSIVFWPWVLYLCPDVVICPVDGAKSSRRILSRKVRLQKDFKVFESTKAFWLCQGKAWIKTKHELKLVIINKGEHV